MEQVKIMLKKMGSKENNTKIEQQNDHLIADFEGKEIIKTY
jgi:uncharacterized protein YneF (UPF0154 family)